jgi:antitoxin component of MazEF toxin-antitoxin module
MTNEIIRRTWIMSDMPRTRDFVKLRKQGNSLVLTVPKGLTETLKWTDQDELYLEVEGEILTVKKVKV